MLWLLAGCLQLQPFMFGKEFSDDVLGSAALSQPAPLAHLITWTQHILANHPAAWNWPLALTELLIGVGMVSTVRGRPARLACAASVGCGLGIWLVGEGAGGLLTGHAALSTGAPGAALLYSVLTVAAWPRGVVTPAEAIQQDHVPARVLAVTWLAVWLVGALLATLPGQWGASGLGAQATMGAMMSPSWAAAPVRALARWLLAAPLPLTTAISVVVVALHLVIALGVCLRGPVRRNLVVAGVVLIVIYWWFGQGFAGLSTGTATDVGTAPLIALLGVALLRSQPPSEPEA